MKRAKQRTPQNLSLSGTCHIKVDAAVGDLISQAPCSNQPHYLCFFQRISTNMYQTHVHIYIYIYIHIYTLVQGNLNSKASGSRIGGGCLRPELGYGCVTWKATHAASRAWITNYKGSESAIHRLLREPNTP